MAEFIRKAVRRMEQKGTVGTFGKATATKIRRGLHSRSAKMRKKAAFAKAMKTIARRRSHKR